MLREKLKMVTRKIGGRTSELYLVTELKLGKTISDRSTHARQ
jgi:hypothetical protein